MSAPTPWPAGLAEAARARCAGAGAEVENAACAFPSTDSRAAARHDQRLGVGPRHQGRRVELEAQAPEFLLAEDAGDRLALEPPRRRSPRAPLQLLGVASSRSRSGDASSRSMPKAARQEAGIERRRIDAGPAGRDRSTPRSARPRAVSPHAQARPLHRGKLRLVSVISASISSSSARPRSPGRACRASG